MMDKRTYIPDGPGENRSYDGTEIPPFPLHVDLELSSRCNLNCVFCDKQPLVHAGQLGDLPFDLFKKIADECAAEGAESIGLSYRGEPLLNASAAEMIRYAKDAGIGWVSFCTNGMLLIPAVSEKLIDAGLDEITVSAQGGDRESFERSRLGSNFMVVSRNVEYLRSIREKKGKENPVIRIQAVAVEELERESFLAYWKERADQILIVPYEDSENRREVGQTSWKCPQPYKRLTVEWDGTILPCNNDDIRRDALGNAWEISLAEAWNGPVMERIRKDQQEGRYDRCPDCRGCPFLFAAAGKDKKYLFLEVNREMEYN